jgi:hypothetical protein
VSAQYTNYERLFVEPILFLPQVWKREGMTTLKDLLIYYNNADVAPFLEAIAKQRTFYEDRHLDMFKQGISVPGLSLRYLFASLEKTPHFFQMFGEKDKDLHTAVKQGIVGGPSIIFCRFQETGLTRLRAVTWKGEPNPQAKLCGGVAGYDANALYLWCTMQDMPTGMFLRRRAPNYKKDWGMCFSRVALDWLNYEAQTRGVTIHNQFDRGGEQRLGPRNRPVDGYAKSINTVFEFHGCYWHGHTCLKGKGNFDSYRKIYNLIFVIFFFSTYTPPILL